MDAGVSDGHIPGVDDLDLILDPLGHPEGALVGAAEAVVLDQIPGGAAGLFRHAADAVPRHLLVFEASAGGLAENLMEEADAGGAFAAQRAAVAPPELAVCFGDVHCLAVAGVAAAEGALPEPADHLLAGDVAPAAVDVALIGDFVEDDRLLVLDAVLVNQLGALVQVDPLVGDVGDPGAVVVVGGGAVVDAAEVAVGVLFEDDRGIPPPVGDRLIPKEVILVGEAPPDVVVCGETGDDVLPVEVVLILANLFNVEDVC